MTDDLTTKHKKALQEPDNAEREVKAKKEGKDFIAYYGNISGIGSSWKEAYRELATALGLVLDVMQEEVKRAEERGREEIVNKYNHLNNKAFKQGILKGLLKGAEMVLDDRFAIQFQTMGQYRTALAQAIRKEAEK